MSNDSNGTARSLGFRHVLEAALFFGALGGLADVSYIFTRSPDLVAEILGGLRFFAGGVVLTALALLLYLVIVFLILKPIASAAKWPFEFSLALLYTFAVLPAGAIVARSFAMLIAEESILVAQVKVLYYFLKYLWVLVPVGWAIGVLLAKLRTGGDFPTLYGRVSAYVLSMGFFLLVTPFWQQRNILAKANVYSELSSGLENMVITGAVFLGALMLLVILNLLLKRFARVGRGSALTILWIVLLLFPFVPKLFATGALVGSRPSGLPLSGRASNVILISLDTVRYDDLGFNGSEIVETPTLDALAEKAVVFDRCITPMPMTGPAHISMLTGLQPDSEYGHEVKSNGVKLAEDIPTLATILDQAGYRTGAIIGGFPLSREASGLEKGFHYYHDIFNESFRGRFLPDQVWYLTVAKILRRAFNIRSGLPHGRTKTADDVTDQAIGWLERRGDQPFFLFVHYFDAHYLYAPPPPYNTMYMPDYDGPYKDLAVSIADLQGLIPSFTEEDFAYYRALYRGEISFVDAQLGRLVEWLDARDLWQDTLVIIVSDHGEGFEHDYYFLHTDRVYDQLIHVPMMILDPDLADEGIEADRIDTLVNVSDIYFTVLNWLNVDTPKDVPAMHEGVMGIVPGWDHDLSGIARSRAADYESLMTAGADEPDYGWSFIASQSYTFTAPEAQSLGRFFTFRFPEWKLIYGPDAEPELPAHQYFDLESDPEEMNDIYPRVDWSTHPWPGVVEVLEAWASRQAAVDLSGLDPQMREELKALGYINEGAPASPDSDEQEP